MSRTPSAPAGAVDRTVASVLAQWCLQLRFEDLPDDVVAKAEDCIIDAIACAVPGRETDGARRIHRVARETYPCGPAPLWFSRDRLGPAGAAFANAASASMLDIDDGHRRALGHPGAAVVPAALATAAVSRTEGRRLLVAVVAGYEACVRIGMSERRKAYHTGNWSGFGACVAAGLLSGLEAEQLTHALAITAYHGPRVADLTLSADMGSNVKESIPWSVVTGLTAAHLASHGFTGCRDALDIEERFAPEDALEGLGEGFLITRTYFKRYSACRWVHSAIEGLLAIMRKHALAPRDIDAIRVECFLQAASLDNLADPDSIESAQYSIPFCLGVAASLGEQAMMPLDPECLHHLEAVEIARKVTVVHQPDMDALFPAYVPSRVTLESKHGSFDTSIRSPWGEPDRAPARSELADKFERLARGRTSAGHHEKIITAVESLRTDDCTDLMNAVQAAADLPELVRLRERNPSQEAC